MPPEVVHDLSSDQRYSYCITKMITTGVVDEDLLQHKISKVDHLRRLNIGNRISQFILGIFHSQFSFALPFILNDFFWISLRWFQSPCHSWIPAAWIKFNSMSISTFLLFAYEAPVTHFSFLSRNTARLAQCKDDMAEDSDSLMWKCPGKRAKM